MLRIALLALALSAGGAAAWLAFSFVDGREATSVATPAQPAPTQEVLVAASDLKRGDKVEVADLRWQAWPENSVNAAFILRSNRADAIETLAGTLVRDRFLANEPILEEKLARGEANFLSAILPSGMRAVALRVTAENTAGGFILPNDRVDVLHTLEGKEGTSAVTQTLLHNVRVLAIDQTAKDNTSESVVGKTATLELDPAQTEMIIAAQTDGFLSLSLRSAADHDDAQGTAEKSRAPETSRVVRIFRAGQSEFVRTQ